MDNINTTAKNEVHQLLNELVVSPISKDLEILLELSESMSKLDDIGNIVTTVNGLIRNMSQEINANVDYQFSNIESNINSLESSVRKIKQQTDQINEIMTNTRNVNSEIQNAIKKVCEYITPFEQVVEDWKRLSEELPDHISKVQASFNTQLIDKYTESVNCLKGSFYEINEIIQNDFNTIQSIETKLEGLSEKLLNMHEDIMEKDTEMNNSINSSIDFYIQKASDSSNESIRMYKQNKNLLMLLVALSILNVMCIIGMIIMHYL